ncbi:hypothetical protein [Agrobacterium sp. MS2]|uniref:hypothetical protein n=1 Tax=Agrobacterium sp. MS2 TaxID=1345498 RepID=UPI000DBFEB85|nr:hypothetical protein [Agrobacterium sp. MS2]RAL98692.1 hypothetical protein DOU54_06435 [Agrobacterium sp. MS2]
MIRYAILGIICATAVPSAAVAQQAHRLKPLDGMSSIIVWKSSDAQSEANQIINSGLAGQDPSILAPYVACIVPPGTQVIVTDMGIVTHDIMIPVGKNKGCRGNIPAENLN